MKLTAKVLALTFIGGAIGTFGRYFLTLLSEGMIDKFWLVNLSGAALIAIFNNVTWFSEDNRRAFFVVGFTGGFTTMSGLSGLFVYMWYDVTAQALLGVAIYLFTDWLIRRVKHA